MAVFGWIAALILILLLIPVWVQVTYDKELKVRVGVLWFSSDISPKKKLIKQKTEKPSTSPAKKKAKKPTAQYINDLPAMLQLIEQCVSPVRKSIKRTTFAVVSVRWVIATGDAAQTAIDYGKASTVAYTTLAAADRLFRLRVKQMEICPDFLGEDGSCYVTFKISVLPLAALAATFNIGLKALIHIQKQKRQDKVQPGKGR